MTDPVELRHTVVDASAIVDLLLRPRDAKFMLRLVEDSSVELHVPNLCDVEVASGIRRAFLRGRIATVAAARTMLDDLCGLPLQRYEHDPLLHRILDLRHNFSAYEASYVALAEALGTSLLTADARLKAATNTHTDVVAHLVATS